MAQLPVIEPPERTDRSSGPRGPLTATERDRIARELTAVVEGEVRFGLHDRMLYATDASLYQVEPIGVVIPASIDDAIRTVEFCVSRELPILPRGGGTSLAGQCTNRAVVLDFSAHCRDVRAVDPPGKSCEVDAGLTVDDLNDDLARHGLFFAPDPATTRQATIGGCIGNNAAGARSILFGRTSENLLGVDALVIAGGEPQRVKLETGAASRDPFLRGLTHRVARVVKANEALIRARFPKTVRRNAGYNLDLILQQMDSAGPRADADAILDAINLSHLVCGSEGTLAVVLGGMLRLHAVPRAKGLAIVGFNSLDGAVEAVGEILKTHPSAVELIDDAVLDLARANAEHRHNLDVMPAPEGGPDALKAVLYVEYFAPADPRELAERIGALMETIERVSPWARVKVCNAAEAVRAWKLRKAGEPLLHGTPGDRKPITFVEDNAVPPERLPEFVREFRAIVQRHGTRAAFWAHASVGVLHVRPYLDIRDDDDRVRLREIAVEVAELARSLGGVMSGEHGDGRVRGPLLERFYGPELMAAFREVKAMFDPRGLLNPGNIVEPGPIESITHHLRVDGATTGAAGSVQTGGASLPLTESHDSLAAVDTYFTYDDQHGLRGAVEMCNGAGVCRKRSGGTMCPSYMATLDERHSTRGRGNALRLAITGQFQSAGLAEPAADAMDGSAVAEAGLASIWDDPDTIATLDLCLSCKACKAECPSNVDVARLKAEYAAQRYRTARPSRAIRSFGDVRRLNRLGSMMPGLANRVAAWPFVRRRLDQRLGLSPLRSLPRFEKPLTLDSAGGGLDATSPRVVLFGDCFAMYNETGIGRAAARVLNAFGYRVELADTGCCARPKISLGLLPAAIAEADATMERLRSAVEDPTIAAILVCEPSCLSAIKDDWPSLKMRSPIDLRRRLAAKAFLPEQFLDAGWNTHPRSPDFAEPAPCVFHGHCHQKALWGAESAANLVRRIAGRWLTVLDSGCCGMAGSFGMTADHYELSMRIGERVLLPAAREAAKQGGAVIAPGTSCRHQIRDGAGVHALHPMEWTASLLK
ncbi:MAG: FAD-binding and (Fe-S)-binding domain-containing protein [Phycisphaerales bacterium]